MPRKIARVLLAACAAGLVLAGPAWAAVDRSGVDKAFADLPKYDWGNSREALNAIDDAVVKSHGDEAARADLETKLLAALGAADSTAAAKQFCCRMLAMIGTVKAVPVLEPMLADKDLSHMARCALERIPGEEASKALAAAAGKLAGPLKIGMINSIGARRDAGSTPMLVGLLKDADPQVASAAAAALGRIGDVAAAGGFNGAAGPLMDYLAAAPKETQAAAYDAALELATGLIGTDKAAAAGIFEKLYAADRPIRVRCAALKGLAVVRPAETTPEIIKALASESPIFRGLAATLVKDVPGAEATAQFAAQLTKLPPDGQVALIDALAARQDPAALPAIRDAATSTNDKVAIAAIAAYGAVGGAQDVGLLVAAAAAGSDKAAAARASLQQLKGKDVDDALIAALDKADPAAKVQVIGALADRAADAAAPAAEKLAASDNADVRQAAIAALGGLGNEKQVPALVAVIRAAKDAAAIEAPDKALAAICIRVKAKAVDDVLAGLAGAGPDAQASLYNALARCGGDKAFSTIVAAAKAGNDGAVRALVSWTAPNGIAPLLDIASTSADKVHKTLAIRGIISLARLKDTPQADALAALAKAMTLADNPEKTQALAALGEIPTIESFKMLASCLDDKALAEAAASSAVKIAPNVMAKDKDLVQATLQKVAASTKNQRTKKLAEQLLAPAKGK
jgi:HEAT repeat protein